MLEKSVDTRLALCRELMGIRSKMESVDARNRIRAGVLAARRMQAIRSVLLHRSGGGLADELLSPAVAYPRLLMELQAIKDQPKVVQVTKAAYVRSITKTLRTIEFSEQKAGLCEKTTVAPPELELLLSDILQGDSEGYNRVGPVVDDWVADGVLTDELREELRAATLGGTQDDLKASSMEVMLAAAFDKVAAEQAQFYEQVSAKRSDPNLSAEEISAFYKTYEVFMDEVYKPVATAKLAVNKAEREKTDNAFARVGKKIMGAVMELSPVSADDATRWANSQTITPTAVKRLRTLGYPVDQVRLDMAEFYRFTHGRVRSATIDSKGDRRANATSIESHNSSGVINLGSSFNKRVLWHELAHHLEADPLAKMAAGHFIRRRSVDGKSYKLRALTNNNGYRTDEVAFKGDFFDPYIGKIYGDGITEVFAMGVESFSNPEILARRAANDPQTLAFIAGYLKTKIDPLAEAHMGLREITQSLTEDVKAEEGDSITKLHKQLADMVTLMPDTDIAWLKSARYQYDRGQWQQLGRFVDSSYHLFKGKVRSLHTKRMQNGFIVAWMSDSGWFSSVQVATTEIDFVKAMFGIYLKTGELGNAYLMNDIEYLQKRMA